LFVKNLRTYSSGFEPWYHANGDSKAPINTARRYAGCVKNSIGDYIPDIEFFEPNEPIYDAVLDQIYTGSGSSVTVHGKYKVPFISDHIFDIIKNGTIDKGVIKSPLIYVVHGSQLILVRYEGKVHTHIKKELELKKTK
jgi:hypothetical protein